MGLAVKVEIFYDGACPFCDDYVRYQRLAERVAEVRLVDARVNREEIRAYGLSPADFEDGMVVVIDGTPHHGAAAVHQLSLLSETPRRAWVRWVGALSRSPAVAAALYPWLKRGRRLALALLRIPRFPRD
jgi:predicted DCC family thiol-disulfide oxidoreductase YuxK